MNLTTICLNELSQMPGFKITSPQGCSLDIEVRGLTYYGLDRNCEEALFGALIFFRAQEKIDQVIASIKKATE